MIPALSDENRLGPYRIIRRLGEGGMGTVYLGYDEPLARHVAIKVLRLQEAGAQSSMAKRFMREARSAARLNHPHVVTIYSVGQTEGSLPRPYLVMEFVDGGSLADALHAHGPLNWRSATGAIRDALRALGAAHDAGIIHRDIKPANLMQPKNGGIKLVDFGLARIFETATDADLTFPGAFVGSPSYASPEQAAGAALMDGRSDLYSLAVTWFTLIAGQPPFIEDEPSEVLRHHLSRPFPDLRELVNLPIKLLDVMAKASEKRPEDRYASATEMEEAVEKILADVSVTAEARAVPPKNFHPTIAEKTATDLETQLQFARTKSDSSTQLAALRGLYGLYTQLDRREDATKVFREALVLHVQMQTPPPPAPH